MNFDPATLDELARVFARAAVDALLADLRNDEGHPRQEAAFNSSAPARAQQINTHAKHTDAARPAQIP